MTRTRMRRGIRLEWVFAAAVMLALVLPSSAGAYTPPPIKHVFVLIDENESESTTFGPGSPAPYLSQTLVSQGAFLQNYYGVGHNSLDNYIAMVSGQAPNPKTQGDCPQYIGFTGDSMDGAGQENGEGCVYPADVPTLMSQLDSAGLNWKAYEDSMGADPTRDFPSQTGTTCGHPVLGTADMTETEAPNDQYATKHDPFMYFHSVIDNLAYCDAHVVNLSQLPTDLQSVSTTPNYSFITPGLCDDGHDATCANGQPGGLAQADSFLKTWVPEIMGSPAFKQDGLLIIAFDEAATSGSAADATACCGEIPGPFDAANGIMPGNSGPGGGVTGAVLLSPFILPGTRSTTPYNHYSMLGSVEDLFGLSRLTYASAVQAFGADVYTNPPQVGPPPPPPTAGQIRASMVKQIVPKGKGARIRTLRKKHDYVQPFTALEAGKVNIKWYQVPRGAHLASHSKKHKRKPILVASGSASFTAAGTETVKVKLTKAGKRVLKKAKKRLKLTAKGSFTPSGGTAVTAKKGFTLRR